VPAYGHGPIARDCEVAARVEYALMAVDTMRANREGTSVPIVAE
jgi:hypothetical protein